MENTKISLNGKWFIDYISNVPYTESKEPVFCSKTICDTETETCSATEFTVPGYFEDMTESFVLRGINKKLSFNPLYTEQRYPQTGYCKDMMFPNPVGCFLLQRCFEISGQNLDVDTVLYVGGVQNSLSAWINGKYIGRHEGYSAEFFMNIPRDTLVVGKNEITLAVSNTRLLGYKGRPISGLTTRAVNECTGGIWGDVEIRFLPDGIRDAWVAVAKDTGSFTVKVLGGEDVKKKITVYDGETKLICTEIEQGASEIIIPCEDYKNWSPDSPYLYTVRICSENQCVERRFGIRRLTVEGNKLFLNGEPYYFRGTCEHCYHPITVYPTRKKEYYKNVILTLKKLGFNSIRFHTYIPMPEYMEVADELGMVLEIETPNNTTYDEWCEIVNQCRHYSSVCAFSSGNEMMIDEEYIEHLRRVAEYVHNNSDALLSPMSAMRGVEYHEYGNCIANTPFPHNPQRLAALGEFCDFYNSYSLELTSYRSLDGRYDVLDERNSIYKKPLLSHEICIQGTYIDLSLKDRYNGSRIGSTEFMSSVEEHLADVGLLERADLYYHNSVKWQKMLRKHCFETVRRADSFAGYDFLGDIDSHWHTFGYCVGMMNEFYELKVPETVENVLRYNSDTVLLCDMPTCTNYISGEEVSFSILVSNYKKQLKNATLKVCAKSINEVIACHSITHSDIECGKVSELYKLSFSLPEVENPIKIILSATLLCEELSAENEWELFVFPKAEKRTVNNLTVVEDIDLESLVEKMQQGEAVLLFGSGPFKTADTRFQLSIAGRTNGHLATVIADHPLMKNFPHDGYCGWQFRKMLNSKAAVLDIKRLTHAPIIDIASSYKNAHREAMLFEYKVGNGRLLVCTLNLTDSDPAAVWLREEILDYAQSSNFEPKDTITLSELRDICGNGGNIRIENENAARNKNDITMI